MNVFVLQGSVEITPDEALKRIREKQAAKKVIDGEINNLKQVVKTFMKKEGLKKYESPEGGKAQFIESQKPKWDKEAILELTGEDFGLCVSYTTTISFKVS